MVPEERGEGPPGVSREAFRESCKVLRAAIMGRVDGPSVFEAMEILGKEECLRWIKVVMECAKTDPPG